MKFFSVKCEIQFTIQFKGLTVRKILSSFICLSILNLGQGAVFADDDIDISTQDFGAEKMESATQEGGHPFRISTHGDWIQRTKIDKSGFRHNHVNFYTITVQGDGVVYYNPCHSEGIGLGIGYINSRFDMDRNPYFKTKNMDQVAFTVSAFSERLKNWNWHTQLTANWEPRYDNFWEYTNYDIILWGRYAYRERVNLHFGFLALTGMKIDHIYPIIGFDWSFCDKWKLNLVFPLNISIIYEINSGLSASLAARIWNIRYRFGEHENDYRGFKRYRNKPLLEYRNYGAELALNYDKGHIAANIHAGVTLGGQFKISNRQNERKNHFDMDSAAYAGGEAVYKF